MSRRQPPGDKKAARSVVETHRSALTCDLFVLNDRDRIRRTNLVKEMTATLRELYEIPTGFGFVFDASTATLAQVLEFIALERLCCPFLRFELGVPEENGPIRMEITGREGVKQYLSTELGIQTGGFE